MHIDRNVVLKQALLRYTEMSFYLKMLAKTMV